MARTKAILAVSSLAMGAALVFMVTAIQRDRLAFTTQNPQASEALTMAIVAPAGPTYVAEPASIVEETTTIRIQALEVKPAVRLRPKTKAPPAPEPVKTVAPPCRPMWRELESGPNGRLVREVCNSMDDVPRS